MPALPKDISAGFGSESWVEAALRDFVEKGPDAVSGSGRYLSLALPENRNFELEAGQAPGWQQPRRSHLSLREFAADTTKIKLAAEQGRNQNKIHRGDAETPRNQLQNLRSFGLNRVGRE